MSAATSGFTINYFIMGIIVSDLSFRYSNQDFLFSHINFSVEEAEKISILGHNGAGKSTLLRLMAGILQPAEGGVVCSSKPYYVPQHTGVLSQNVDEVLCVSEKLRALDAIGKGSVLQADYDALADDWDVEERCKSALAYWGISHVPLNSSMNDLSGGEKTKVYLAGLLIHAPEIILLDEPTNHLDQTSRALLYRYIEQSRATIVAVSHDVALLNLLNTTCELSEFGIKLYGGNYDFYREQKELQDNALSENIRDEEKALRLARKKAQEVRQRQERRASQGEKNKAKGGAPPILLNAKAGSAENTAAKLKDKHAKIIDESQKKLSDLRQQQSAMRSLKVDFDNTSLHAGKLLVEASQINFAYHANERLWPEPVDFKLYSSDRIHILGSNGAGKTTFTNLLTGVLAPLCGEVRRADFSWIYLDQNYTRVDVSDTVVQLAERYNTQALAEHEIKIRLNRFLFPPDTWDKSCRALSGGEKMRLYLCCLMISTQTPDLIILDEPTNNLDIASLDILTQTIKNYRGSLLVISHDRHFVSEVGVSGEVELKR